MSICKQLNQFFADAFRAGEEVTFKGQKVWGFTCSPYSNRIDLNYHDETKPINYLTDRKEEVVYFDKEALTIRRINVEVETMQIVTPNDHYGLMFRAKRK